MTQADTTLGDKAMAPPRLVIFDMDEVLFHYDPAARQAAMGAMAGLDAAEVARRVWDSGIEDSSDDGSLDADGYLRAVGDALGMRYDRAAWLEGRRCAMRPNLHTLALARAAKERARIALLTNNGFIMREHFDVLVPQLRPIFGAAMHVAAEFGTKKPDPDVFRRLVALYDVAPAQAMMIDDQARHIAGARSAGLLGHHFTGAPGLEAQLRALALA
ncbi:MAG TPA: HAD-IA family hydrolase [Xanthobacteraceae bacterium]|nr:HAD-IA family hydrolase [Xanthobacteraceae bacterium]